MIARTVRRRPLSRRQTSGHQSANVTGRVIKGSRHWLMEGAAADVSELVAFINALGAADPS